jgi:hypothetical protein
MPPDLGDHLAYLDDLLNCMLLQLRVIVSTQTATHFSSSYCKKVQNFSARLWLFFHLGHCQECINFQRDKN